MKGRHTKEAVWVVVPAHNEERVIGDVITELLARFNNVVVIDDGSIDQTGPVARYAGATVLRHVINRGQGAALQTGLDFALARGAKFIATFDADGQHNPADLASMLARLEESHADVALGSRFLGSAPGLSLLRRTVIRAAILFQYMSSGLKLSDAHNGLRLFRREAAERIRIRQDRMAHASEIIAQISALQLSIVEVPCVVRYTTYSIRKGQRLSGSFQILLDLAIRRLHK